MLMDVRTWDPGHVWLALFVVFGGLALAVSPYWHAFARDPTVNETFLSQYDSKVFESQDACFALNFNAFNAVKDKPALVRSDVIEEVLVLAQSQVVFREKVSFTRQSMRTYCVPSAVLVEGENKVEAFVGEHHVYFHVEKTLGPAPEAQPSSIQLAERKENVFVLNVFYGNTKNSILPLNVFVNGQHVKSVFVEGVNGKTVQVEIDVPLEEGISTVRFEFDGTTLDEQVVEPAGNVSPWVGVSLFLFLVALLFFAAFTRYSFVDALTFGFFVLIAFFIGFPWAFNVLGIPLTFASVGGGLALVVAAVLVFLVKFKPRIHQEGMNEFSSWLVLGFMVMALFLTFAPLILPSHYTVWNVFYERGVDLVVETNGIPSQDPLSYLGRGFTFVWGYFLTASSIALITGLKGTALFALVVFFLNAFFLVALFAFCQRMGFKGAHAFLFFLVLLSSIFLFVNFLLSPKHVLDMALLFLALAYALQPKPCRLLPFVVGLAAFTQVSSLGFFALSYVAVARKVDWKTLSWGLGGGLLVFLVLFAPILLAHGLPVEVHAQQWGYGITNRVGDVVSDVGVVVFVVLLLAAVRVLWKWNEQSFYVRKLLLAGVALVGVELFITYRVNVVTQVVAGMFLFAFFEGALKEKWFYSLLGVVALVSIAQNVVVLEYATAFLEEVPPMEFVNTHTPVDARFLADPYYGHLLAFAGKRQVLADLYVEYADNEKLSDAFDFVLHPTPGILEKYDLNGVVVDSTQVYLSARQVTQFSERLEIPFLDKVYDNGRMTVYWRAGSG
ncbi:MAG: hypothetical protein HY393_02125 [Candidatus Diapherotrites archaeon]|nr:hypothetical protein [Candidatus Diapherotrites archaeon]